MRVDITIYKDGEGVPFRKLKQKPRTIQDVEEVAEVAASFIQETFEEIEEEGF